MQVGFKTKKFKFLVKFNDIPTAQEIIRNLPIESTVSRWGDEIYFDIGFELTSSAATTEVRVGDVAYWAEGKSACVFFGPTPMSTTDQPVPAGPVVLIGKTVFSPDELRSISAGEKITLEKEEVVHDSRILSQGEIDNLIKRLRG